MREPSMERTDAMECTEKSRKGKTDKGDG